jgi:ATP synthase protein I
VSGARSETGWKIIGWQFLLAVLVSAALLPVFDLVVAYSGLAGGLIAVAANAIFAIRVFDDRRSWQPEHLAASLYRGLLGKYFLTIALFVSAMVLLEPLNISALFAVYLLVQLSPAFFAGILKA